MHLLWLLFISLCSFAFAQREALRVGDGVSSPKLIHQVEPAYSSAAQSAGIQGAVVMGVVINEKGELEDIEFLSPLGFGLDEEALKAIKLALLSWFERTTSPSRYIAPLRSISNSKGVSLTVIRKSSAQHLISPSKLLVRTIRRIKQMQLKQ